MKRDFSAASKQQLFKLVAEVENEKINDFTDFVGDRWLDFQSWIGLLNIKNHLDNVNKYHKKVIDKNNTSSDEIEKIFDDVNSVCDRYKTKLSSLLSSVKQYRKTISALAAIVSPLNGKFNVNTISKEVGGAVNDYLYNEAIRRLLAISDEQYNDFDNLDGDTIGKVLSSLIAKLSSVLPDIGINDKREIPIGSDMTLYYEVSGTIDINSQSDIALIIKEQKEKFKDIHLMYSSDIGDAQISADITKENIGSMSVKSGNSKVTFKKGECEATITTKFSNTTYTLKISYSGDLVCEETITTELETGSISSTIGIKKAGNSKWKPLQEPAYNVEENTIPILPSSDIQFQSSPVSIYDINIDKKQLQDIIKELDELLAAFGTAFTLESLSGAIALCLI